MAWETRAGRRYYYTARREGKRVVKEYVPPLVAEARALIDNDRRAVQFETDEKLREAKAELDALETALKPLQEYVDSVAAAAMLAAGYHRHNRGAWRKRRNV